MLKRVFSRRDPFQPLQRAILNVFPNLQPYGLQVQVGRPFGLNLLLPILPPDLIIERRMDSLGKSPQPQIQDGFHQVLLPIQGARLRLGKAVVLCRGLLLLLFVPAAQLTLRLIEQVRPSVLRARFPKSHLPHHVQPPLAKGLDKAS